MMTDFFSFLGELLSGPYSVQCCEPSHLFKKVIQDPDFTFKSFLVYFILYNYST